MRPSIALPRTVEGNPEPYLLTYVLIHNSYAYININVRSYVKMINIGGLKIFQLKYI